MKGQNIATDIQILPISVNKEKKAVVRIKKITGEERT